MRAPPQFRRHHEIRKIRNELERDSFPRLQMFLLVTLTGTSGFVASFILLHAGLVAMWLRYLAAFGVAYLMFLLLLWLWLRTRSEDYAELPELSEPLPSGAGDFDADCTGKGENGGDVGDGASDCQAAHAESILENSDTGSSVGDALGSVADADEFAVPLAVLILLGAMLFSILFMIYSAPVLFAELLVDGVLSASLYRRLRGLETRHWLETALRRTALPFALTAAVVSAAGWGMALYVPEAHSIGDVISRSKQISS